MKHTFSNIEEGDTLYVVYTDLNGDYQIGEAKVTGFCDWVYEDTDRYTGEIMSTQPMRNMLYEFKGISFSRGLEYALDKTALRDCVRWGVEYKHIMKREDIYVCITYEEAAESIKEWLNSLIDNCQKQIDILNTNIQKYSNNLQKYT